MNDMETDVMIIGGGLIGGPLACALATAGLSVSVVDAEDPAAAAAAGFDGRALAVALSSQRLLATIGLWPALVPFAAPINEIRVSDGTSPLFLHYDHNALGDDPFGWIVENHGLRRAVAARLAELPAITRFAATAVAGVERGAGRASAVLADGRRLTAAVAIAADGRASPTRTAAGIGVTGWDYGQAAIVCTVRHSRPHNDTARERFLPAGPFAILPLPGQRSSVVWSETAHLVPPIVGQDDAGFLAELKSRFGGHLGDIALEGPRFAYPLSLQVASAYWVPRLALAGDAAHGMHPVAGQGMNMGLRDVAALAEVLVDAKRLGLDLGSPTVLARYGRWRRFDNLLMLGVTDGLVRLFSNDLGPLKVARGLGLAAVDRMAPVKRLLMRHAMGLVGQLPKLLKGQAL
jgi:2-octaprenyl-6-methoxyphenol hydroxylase